MTITSTTMSTSTTIRTDARLGEALSLDLLRERSTRFDRLQVHIAPDPHWIRLVVSDSDGAVEMCWLAAPWATYAGLDGLSVTLHSVHPLCPDRRAEELGEDCELTGDEATAGVCYPDTLADDALARDIRPMLDADDLGPVIVVLASYHRDLLNR
ncbi:MULTISPECIES: hypothetical protein [unclassified Pseudonocardia]|uniref:hypothetical protein n=1 Tax=unclassified Pseudonocardia TaxID=2619320 RepID=UPI0001FFE9C1|nr:hypothetical protein [Pseudonocardia sp. Ae707_Ps1]OLM09041.1 hypothetical protein Ae707Ps1_5988 [Pseudonocardia sp. Ae707_Ps1]